ncbi:MAG: DNA alkylation repair protein [Euryarchaeota archaeon]|nr:DNA alkylation repair protein [Euryarchaeota archaeon]
MPLEVNSERGRLVHEIHGLGKAGGDAWLQKYLGSPHPVLGLSVPQIRGILAAFRKAHPDLAAKEVNALAAAIYGGPTFEEKSFAVSLLDRHAKVLDDASWRLLDRWVDESVGWGMCDSIGAGPIAKMVYAKPSRFQELLRWTKSPNFWRRRIACYALHDFVFAGELDKPFWLLEGLLVDDEFWVQRAVGTWLRECWKKDRRRAEAFLRKHVRGLPPVVITVATERAPKAFREELRRKSKTAKRPRKV